MCTSSSLFHLIARNGLNQTKTNISILKGTYKNYNRGVSNQLARRRCNSFQRTVHKMSHLVDKKNDITVIRTRIIAQLQHKPKSSIAITRLPSLNTVNGQNLIQKMSTYVQHSICTVGYQPLNYPHVVLLTKNYHLTTKNKNQDAKVDGWTKEIEAKVERRKDRNEMDAAAKPDMRAKAKLLALAQAKIKTNNSKKLCASHSIKMEGEELEDPINEDWLRNETELSQTYSKAIKYVARTRAKNAASKAEDLLYEWIERIGVPRTEIQLNGNFQSGEDKSNSIILSKIIQGERCRIESDDLPDLSKNTILLPTKRDFQNVLHSWAISKARRKGPRAESILYRMVELSRWYPDLDLFGALVDSKAFALVVRCYAGSTHQDSLKKVINLHEIHEKLSKSHAPFFIRDDPFFLMHSIKSIKNYRNQKEVALLDDWINRLHSFVTNPLEDANESVYHERNENKPTNISNSNLPAIDLTGTYTTIIREYAKLKGKAFSVEKASEMLQKMHEVLDYIHSTQANKKPSMVAINIKVNAYNLILGLHNDCKDKGKDSAALALLDDMIDSWNNKSENNPYSTVPYPTDQSFAYCIGVLSHMNDMEAAKKEADRLLSKLEDIINDDDLYFTPSTIAYNACLKLYARFALKVSPKVLFPMCFNIVKRMEHLSSKYPEVKPDIETWCAILKVCATDGGDAMNRTEKMETATKIFKDLSDNNLYIKRDNALMLNDKAFFYMMKCVANNVIDSQEKEEKILDLFTIACKKGMVNANVLKLFQNNISQEIFSNKVGNGRLANNWVVNVTSSKALYTDGSTRGRGKNTRRKGKRAKKGKNVF